MKTLINTLTVVSMLAITAAVTATTLHAADPAKVTPRTLTAKEASLEAQRQVRELAERLRESDRKATMGGVVIDGLYSAGASGATSSGNAAGKR